MDQSKKFLYFNIDTAGDGTQNYALSYPISSFWAAKVIGLTTMLFYSKDPGRSDVIEINVTITSGKGKEVMKAVAETMNFSNSSNIVVIDDAKNTYLHPDILSINSISYGDTTANIRGHLNVQESLVVGGSVTVAGAATFNGGIQRFVSLTETAAILVANSGIPHIVGPDVDGLASDAVFTLPTASAGLYYKFIYVGGEAPSDTQDFTLDTGSDTNFFIGGVSQFDTNLASFASEPDVVLSDNNSNSKITVLIPAPGTCVEVFCDGTNWFISGIIISADNTNPSFADQS